MSDGAPSRSADDAGPGRVVVVGPGRVGLSLAAALSAAGHGVSVRGRSPDPPPFLASLPGVDYGTSAPAEPGRDAADTLVFCVPDDALAEAAGAWASPASAAGGGEGASGADRGDAGSRAPRVDPGGARADDDRPPRRRPVALHTSGVHGADALAPLRDAGRAVAACHPLTSVSAPRADAFREITFGIGGDPAAAERARALARAVGGRPLGLEPGAHSRYHGAAVFASNFLVACLSVAARELAAATGGEGSLDDLLPLARAAVENVAEDGLAAGATGPLARGDAGTVRRHLEALPGDPAALYRRLARELLDVVGGRLEPREAEELRRLLEDGPDAGDRPDG